MKLLLCSPVPLERTLGAGKHHVELAEAIRKLGWTVDLIGPEVYGLPVERHADLPSRHRLAYGLREYLSTHASSYDVVDYDHGYLPYDRSEFAPETLFVARSVLLAHHLRHVHFPRLWTPRRVIGEIVRGRSRRKELREVIAEAERTVEEADLVNVLNEYDRERLVRSGLDPTRVVVVPLGLNRDRLRALAPASVDPPTSPTVAFIGTFDDRKGGSDFPDIVARAAREVPDVRFRLLGTSGMFQTAESVLNHFPRKLRTRVEVVPKYAPAALPELLAGCSLGVFPSYLEGFSFGVLEMLGAGLPVVAYDAPGPPEMLTSDYLVPAGDVSGMAVKLVALLRDRDQLRSARRWARERAGQFLWSGAAQRTIAAYTLHLERRSGLAGQPARVDAEPSP